MDIIEYPKGYKGINRSKILGILRIVEIGSSL